MLLHYHDVAGFESGQSVGVGSEPGHSVVHGLDNPLGFVPVSGDTNDDAPSGANGEKKTHRECASADEITKEGQKIREAVF